MAFTCGFGWTCMHAKRAHRHVENPLPCKSAPSFKSTAALLALSGCLSFTPLSPLQSINLFDGLHVQYGTTALASGLFQMPPTKLNNRYFLVRAGESEFETHGVINTNPVSKTSLENGLSEHGKQQTAQAAVKLKNMEACKDSCWIWPSITQRSYQAAEVIAYVNDISRSRIVPEYSFLDARGLGAYEGKELSFLTEVYNMDSESLLSKPPPNTNGTPNESVKDVFVRLTQVMSVIETQYSGENIIIVSPDSDNLSILEAGLYGIDLRRHSELAFLPGEVREVKLDSIPLPRTPTSGYFPSEMKERQ